MFILWAPQPSKDGITKLACLVLSSVAEWVRALALNGDRTFPAGFDSHCGRL